MNSASDISSVAAKPKAMDEQSKVKLQKAVKDFESIFVGYLLKSMRSNVSKENLFGDSFGGDMVEGMFDTELAKHISRNSNLGLAEMLYRHVTGEDLPTAAKHLSRTLPAAPVKIEAHPKTLGKNIEKALPQVTTAPAVATKVEAKPLVHVQVSATKETVSSRLENYESIIMEAAEKHGLDANLIKAVIASESAGNTQAHSGKNAKGLMQLIDSTATAMGVNDVWNPRENIFGGTKYLKQMLEKFDGDVKLALASYNAGPGAVEKHG
ncbi:MAG: transglycosylase SLT domain-containing protein, partial [Ignavibacteriales bacterium]|nr:transglycosylase SLT domain-containing protein [Ignavibacteriales bacterium]